MAFKPDTFLQTARDTLKSASTEADYRTAAGRSYYAAYGFFREQLCTSKAVTPEKLFNKRGRHGAIASLVSRTKPFTLVSLQYNGLLTLRARSDYVYPATVSKSDAADAVTDAEWVLRKLRDFKPSDFKSFPLAPPDHRP